MVFCAARLLIGGQILLATIAVVTFSVSPPDVGELLLIPLASSDRSATATIALAGGATLIDAGPIRGSMIIRGDRMKVEGKINGWNMILTAAPSAGCGQGTASTNPPRDRV
jgi:hypothetical protein